MAHRWTLRRLGRPLVVALLLAGCITAATTRADTGGAGASGAAPTVAWLSPASGSTFGTTEVKLVGSGFTCGTGGSRDTTTIAFGDTRIRVGSTNYPGGAPNVLHIDDTEILVTDPPHTAGPVPVTVTTACGSSTTADRFTYVDECTNGCTVGIGSTPQGAAKPKIGVLDGASGGWESPTALRLEALYLDSVRPATWRTPSDPNATTLYAALVHKPAVEFVLSGGFGMVAGAQAPWAGGYALWDRYVTAMFDGETFQGPNGWAVAPPGPVAYWDIWNEPMPSLGSPYDFYGLFAHTDLLLHRLSTAARPGTPGAANAAAKVLVASVASLVDFNLPTATTAPLNTSNYISMKDLFDWILRYNATPGNEPVHFDGYSVHVINPHGVCFKPSSATTPSCAVYPVNSPQALTDAANRVRNLLNLDAYRSLRPAEIHINEFGTAASARNGDPLGGREPGTDLVPGWQAGYIAAAEAAGVDGAGLSCWDQRYAGGLLAYSQCQKGFDGLLIDDGQGTGGNRLGNNVLSAAVAPQAPYWVYRFYAGMVGNRLPSISSATDVTAYATQDPATATLRVLLGRHRRCSPDTSRDLACPADAPAAPVTLRVLWPYSGGTVAYSIQQIPNVGGGFGGSLPEGQLPPPLSGRAAVVGGAVDLSLPMLNGAAYTVVLHPAG
jgi:hypothetical protein